MAIFSKNVNATSKNTKSFLFKSIVITVFIILFLFSFLYITIKIKNDIKVFFHKEFKRQITLLNYRIDTFFQDSTSFLFYTKKYLETQFKLSPTEKYIQKEFNKKYTKTKRNQVSNFKFVFEKRKDRKKISTSYLSKDTVVNNDIKYITVISERLDQFWKLFLKKYPFVTMTYVDITGFYREFPFRKIEPKSINYLSDPRNYPYFAIATTVAKNEIFLTPPYKNGDALYVSLVISVYKDNNFRGILTIDIELNSLKKIIEPQKNQEDNTIYNVLLFDNKGSIYGYLFEENKKNELVNIENFKEILKNQEKLLTKNIKIYPIIKSKKLVNFIQEFLRKKTNSKEKTQVQIIKNYAVSISSINQQNLNVLFFIPVNYFNFLNFVYEIGKGMVIVLLLLIFMVVTLFLSIRKGEDEKEQIYTIINKINDSQLREKIIENMEQESSQNKNFFENAGNQISFYINKIKNELNILKILIDNLNLGIIMINEKENLFFTNKWFKKIILDVDNLELMPDELKNEIHKFKNSNLHQFQKMVKLFDRHYILTGDKLITGPNENKQTLIIFTLTNAENLNKIKTETTELRKQIEQLEEKLFAYRKSYENLNTKIIQSDKFAVFGELIQGIVHNINNPLMIVTSRLSMVKNIIEGLEDSMEKRRLLKHITNIINSLNKINEIIDSVLAKAKMTVEKEERLINVNEIIKSELEFFKADLFFKHKVEIDLNLDKELPKVRISQSDFSQVLHNLIKNAIDALKSSANPRLTVKTYAIKRFVFIEISDNGPGVPEKYREKIFDQYFTTKGSQGTGIGLYNARKIIEEYEGELTLEDSKQGAKFVIKLPAIGG